jgi:transcriptional regulator of acetoin/glycerol metabolism
MAAGGETLDQEWTDDPTGSRAAPIPGLVLVFSSGQPMLVVIPLEGAAATRRIELGRGPIGPVVLDDACISRRHAEVSFDGRAWRVRDLGSKNGTAVDATTLADEYVGDAPRVVRVGDSLFLPRADVRRLRNARVDLSGDTVIGPTLGQAWDAIADASRSGETLYITGESGAGKELAAQHFHRSGPHPSGPFVAVNCANIPEGLAERLLFGTRRGAYSGATSDADGYLQAADGGTLFLDEVAELDLAVQAKLLRVLETREVTALGAAKPRPLDLRVCVATHRELRAQVAQGRFRDDLYFRIGRPEVAVPPLRGRLEEMPWLIARELQRASLRVEAHVSLVEACLVRPWPGNVRELLIEVRAAGADAQAAGLTQVEASHLGEAAGVRFRP